MTSIRRLPPGISSLIGRATLDVETEPVSPLAPREPLQPVPAVRRGFSEQSDFQPDAEDGLSPLATHTPHLEGYAGPGAPQQLRVFSGESSFEPAAPRYAQRLGSQLPASLGAPLEPTASAAPRMAGRGSGVQDPSDILSADAAAWELQNLDTSTPSVVEPEDLLFMLDPPGSSGPADPVVELGLDDILEEDGYALDGTTPAPASPQDPGAIDDGFEAGATEGVEEAGDNALGAAYAATFGRPGLAPQLLDPAVSPAGPDEFLADTNDLGSLVPEEPSPGDAALAGVLGSLAANPAAASVPASAALASQGVEAVVDPQELQADATTATSEAPAPAAQDSAPVEKPEG